MADTASVSTRLRQLREAAVPKFSIRAIADALGMSSSGYNHYEQDFKEAYLPLALTQQLASVLAERGVDKRDVLALAGITENNVPQSQPEQMADQLDAVLLPEIEVGYSMGGGSDVEDFPIVQMVPFSRSWLRGLTDSPASSLFVARGDGDSMMPTLLDQDIVIIDRSQKRMRNQDRIWAVAYGGFSMIKRLRGLPDGTIEINSDNQSVSPIRATEDEMFIIGRVVGIIRRI